MWNPETNIKGPPGGDKTVLDYGAVGDGVHDDSQAFEDFWDYIKASQTDPGPLVMDWVTTKYIIPPGKYRVTRSIDWTMLKAWNVHIEANGAVIWAEVNGRSVLDICGCRGIHIHGLGVQTQTGYTPTSAFLIGPASGETCGNNRFEDIKTQGDYSIAAFHNVGSETTQYHQCYFQNGVSTGYGYAGDGGHNLGAVSDYVTFRTPGAHTSFTHNAFYSCRFSNYNQTTNASRAAVYLEETAGWFFDMGCYFLAYDGAAVLVKQGAVASTRTNDLRLNGLFETAFAPSLKYAVKFVCPDGMTTALDGFELDVGRYVAAQTAIVRLETPSGADMTTGMYSLRMARIRADRVSGYTSATLFSGARLSFNGEIRAQDSAMINLTNIVEMHGTIYTGDRSLMTVGTQPLHAYVVYDDATAAKQALSIGGSTGFATVKHGVITLPADPANPLEAATKQYVDSVGSGGGIADAPNDGSLYGRQSLGWQKGVKLAGDTMTGVLSMPATGTAAASSINFGTAGTGFYGDATTLRATTAGTLRLSITGSVVASTLPIGSTGGSAAAVGIHFGAAGTGFWGTTAVVSVATGGTNRMTVADAAVTTTIPISLPSSGTAAATVLNFGTAGTGIYGDANSVRLIVGGVQRLATTNTVNAFAQPLGVPGSGTAAATALTFGTAGTGLYGDATSVSVATAGTNRWTVNATALTTTVPVTLPADPATALQAATKQYVDARAMWQNRVINSAMHISQENASNGGSVSGYYPVDQFYLTFTHQGVSSIARVAGMTPGGAPSRLRTTVTTPDASMGTTDYIMLVHPIEGERIADFRWGTASAKQAILRFGCVASVAGTYVVTITRPGNRNYIASFTITGGQAGQDTLQTVVIPADTGGTWDNGAGVGVSLCFVMGAGTSFQRAAGWGTGNFFSVAGATNLMATNGAIFDIFDVGLYLDEPATGAPPLWELPDAVEELAKCKRYYQKNIGLILGGCATGATTNIFADTMLPTEMRITPAVAFSSIAPSNSTAVQDNGTTKQHLRVYITASSAGNIFCTYDVALNARL